MNPELLNITLATIITLIVIGLLVAMLIIFDNLLAYEKKSKLENEKEEKELTIKLENLEAYHGDIHEIQEIKDKINRLRGIDDN